MSAHSTLQHIAIVLHTVHVNTYLLCICTVHFNTSIVSTDGVLQHMGMCLHALQFNTLSCFYNQCTSPYSCTHYTATHGWVYTHFTSTHACVSTHIALLHMVASTQDTREERGRKWPGLVGVTRGEPGADSIRQTAIYSAPRSAVAGNRMECGCRGLTQPGKSTLLQSHTHQ